MKKNIILISILSIILLYGFRKPSSGDKKIIHAAQNQLSKYIELIPKGQEERYGFNAQDNLTKCTIGTPYQMLVLTNDFYQGKTIAADIQSNSKYLTLNNEWRVPIVLNDKYRTLLTIVFQEGNYNVVDMGGALLSTELQEKSNNEPNANYYILRIYPIKADFLVVSKKSPIADAKYIPMTSALISMPSLRNKSVLTLTEVLKIVKSTLNEQSKNSK